MIPRAWIDAWRATAPWNDDAWVEQDLVISRVLVEMFRVEDLAQSLAFRGGTALFKLHLTPAPRYSEDIDLVQVRPEPIGVTVDLVRGLLDPWLGPPKRQFKEGRVNLVYRFASEAAPPVPMRLKIEINSREHFSELGLTAARFTVENPWFTGQADVTTYALDELLGTKLRALYQRKKGRDLFDLWTGLESGLVDEARLVRCFERCLREGGHAVSRAELEANLARKAAMRDFRGDIAPLLRPGVSWDFDTAFTAVSERLVRRVAGEPWKGPG